MTKFKQFLVPVFFLFVFCFTLHIAKARYGWRHYSEIVIWDTEGYYIYLPAVFIYHGFEGIPAQTHIFGTEDTYLHKWPGSDKVYTKYTCGEALLIAPFWLIAHAIASERPDIYRPDGYSTIYMILFLISIAFYLTLGLFFAWRVLRNYFSDVVILLALACIWMGTSFIQYTAFNPGNSHVFSFFLISLFVYQTPGILRGFSFRSVFFFALTFGWIALLRPPNAIVILFPLLYSIRSKNDIKQRIAYLRAGIRYLPLFIACVLIMFLPQLSYWKYVTGQWFIFSYVGEGFFYWKNPKIIQVLFDAQNGFFVYAPLMLLAIPGFIMGWRQKSLNMPANLIIVALATYTFGSWSCWWYGAGYGHRAFIDFFIFLLFPLCVLFSRFFESKPVVKYAFVITVVALLMVSYRLNEIYSYPWEGPNWGWSNVILKYKEALFIK